MQKLAGVITEAQYNQKIQMLDEDLRAGVYNDFIKWKESFEDETEFPQENGYVVAKKFIQFFLQLPSTNLDTSLHKVQYGHEISM